MTYSESFSDNLYKDASESTVSGWDPAAYASPSLVGPAVKLSLTGSRFTASQSGNLNLQVVSTASGAIGHSKKSSYAADDIVVLGKTKGNICLLGYYSFASGWMVSAPSLDTSAFHLISEINDCGPGAAIAVADVNQDGLDDITVITIDDPNDGATVTSAALLINSNNGAQFSQVDLTSAMQSAHLSWHGRGNPIVLTDIDGDGALDLLALRSYGNTAQVLAFLGSPLLPQAGFGNTPVVLVPYLPVSRPIADVGVPPSGGADCLKAASSVSRGATGLGAADFNNDGLTDLVVAAPDDSALWVLLQQTTGGYAQPIAVPLASGSQSVWARDVDGDGNPDLLTLQVADGCNAASNRALALYNSSLDGHFDQLSAAVAASTAQASIGTPLTQPVTQGTSFSRFATGVFFADPNVNSNFTVAKAYPAANLYAVTARAQSLDVLADAGRSQDKCLTSATVNISAHPSTSGNITFWLSADDGVTFEPLTSDELAGTVAHPFVNAGSELVWRADFFAPAAGSLNGTDALYSPAARHRPTLNAITLTANLLPPFTYSRAAAAMASWLSNGNTQDFLISAAAQVPNQYGFLTAVPLQTLSSSAANNVETITTTRGVSSQNDNAQGQTTSIAPAWNAGTLLAQRAGASRTLFGAYTPSGTQALSALGVTTWPTSRVEISAAELSGPSTNPPLQQLMGLPDSTKLDLLRFINSGMNDTMGNKLYDPGHSSPVVLGAPSQDANLMGQGTVAAAYASYQVDQAARGPVILLGSNGGMLHAFDGPSGAEIWAFTPRNLLPKLREQAQRQTVAGAPSVVRYRHQYFVDGPITVADIYAGNRWRTVAVVGQGQGADANNASHYFAVDVTNPNAPAPLWEVGQAGLDPSVTCDGQAASAKTPQCNNRSDLQCCPYGSTYFCAPATSTCAQAPPSMGQALSKAAIGRVQTSTGDAWVAFFASGYNTIGVPNVGRTLYAVDAYTGAAMGTWTLPDIAASSGNMALPTSVVAGVKLVDADGDGFVDRLYVGDLAGRMWKLNTWATAAVTSSGAMANPNQWATCLMYDAGAGAGGSRGAAPITATAAAAVMGTEAVNVYFGTGGDDSAPTENNYTFFGIRDSDPINVCSSNKHTGVLIAAQGEFAIEDASAGFRFWAEPTIVDGVAVYFSSFSGSLERIGDLAELDDQVSHLYGVAIRPYTGAQGQNYRAGQSVLGNSTAFYNVNGALRTAPVERGAPVEPVTRAYQASAAATTPTQLLIQEGQGSVLRLDTTGAQINKPPVMKRVRWRQVLF